MELRRNLAETHAADCAAEEMKEALSAARDRHDNVKREFNRRVASLERSLVEERKKPHKAPYDTHTPGSESRREQIRNARNEDLAKRPGAGDGPTPPTLVAGALRNGPQPRQAELHPRAIPPAGVNLPGMPGRASSPHQRGSSPSQRHRSPHQRITSPQPQRKASSPQRTPSPAPPRAASAAPRFASPQRTPQRATTPSKVSNSVPNAAKSV